MDVVYIIFDTIVYISMFFGLIINVFNLYGNLSWTIELTVLIIVVFIACYKYK